jgi:hypothetical protein
MSFAGGACLELGFREKLPRESVVIPETLLKGLHGGLILAYVCPAGHF